ncbi:MAG: glycosyltransferase [Gelidibacter sp.]|nr:glycosyltransferase [Gelidibacter sp.]
MIIVYHQNNQISNVVSVQNERISFSQKDSIAAGLLQIAEQFPNQKIVWCHLNYSDNLDLVSIDTVFHHDKMMLSYAPWEQHYLGEKIGYVEESPFININKKVTYPSWQMSNVVGVLHASLLLAIKDKIKLDSDFDYYLNSVAKVCMPLGLFCYSEPKLLKGIEIIEMPVQTSNYTLFKFVKQHYKARWVFLLFLNLMIYEKQFPFLAFLYAGFFKNRNKNNIKLDDIVVNSSLEVINTATIDVIIPTIGRKSYLYDVLCDLRKQTVLPKNVIIVEQNPLENSSSELDYLHTEVWPFAIKHTFTHQAGVCNARNIALSQIESDWVFLNDDDNRFDADLLKNVLQNSQKYGVQALITSYLKTNEKLNYKFISQTGIFGSGNSFVKTSCLIDVSFDMSFEFGYGEDTDFGLQLRNKGYDIIYFPSIKIGHLYAPIGGFRIKPILAWDTEVIQPKPSPTIMLLKLKYDSEKQFNGYKLLLFLQLFIKGNIKNPIKFYFSYKKKWNKSVFWAEKIRL